MLRGQQEHAFAVLGAGKMGNGFVHGDQDHTALHSETKKIGIGDLLGAIEPSEKWAAQSLPVISDGQVVVPRLLGDSGENRRRLTHSDLTCTRRGRITKKAGLGKRQMAHWRPGVLNHFVTS